MNKITLLLIFMASLIWSAGSGHYTWDQSSAEFSTILIPAGYTPTIDNVDIESGDEVAVFTPTGECAGALVWSGSSINVAVNAWEDNGSTPDSTEGFKSGNMITVRIWDSSESKEYVADVVYSVGDGIYERDMFYEISSINVNIPDTTINESNWHVIYKDTVIDVANEITADKDTVVSTTTKEFTSDTLYEQTDSLSDGVVYASDTIKSVDESWLTLDSVVVVKIYKPDTTTFDTTIYYSSVEQTSDSVDTTYSQDLDTVITTVTKTIVNDTTIIQTDSLSDAVVFNTVFDTVYWDTTYSDTTVDTLFYDDPVAIEKDDVESAEKKISAFAVYPSVIDPNMDTPVSFYLSKEVALQAETFEIAIFDMVGNLIYGVDETRLRITSDSGYCKISTVGAEQIRNDARIAGQFLSVVKIRCSNGSTLRYKQFIGIKK